MEVPAAKVLKKLDKAHGDKWRDTILAMYDQGASDREIMRYLNLTPAAWQMLRDDIVTSDFGELIELGKMYSWAWWEAQGRKNLNTKQFNASLWTINMKNRFGWSEKSEQSLTNVDVLTLDTESLNEKARKLQAKLGLDD